MRLIMRLIFGRDWRLSDAGYADLLAHIEREAEEMGFEPV
jgi:hypothetical protein